MKKLSNDDKVIALDVISDLVLNHHYILERVLRKNYNSKLDLVQITLDNYHINLQMSDKYLYVEMFDIRMSGTNALIHRVDDISLIDLFTNTDIHDIFVSQDCDVCYF